MTNSRPRHPFSLFLIAWSLIVVTASAEPSRPGGHHEESPDIQTPQASGFFADSSAELSIRSQYFRQQNEGIPGLAETWALGGSLLYRSGFYADTIGIGIGFYSSNGLYKPTGSGGTKLLRTMPDGSQQNIQILGQAYLELRQGDYRFRAYRQAIDTPFINEHFDRMIPQLFEAYVVGSSSLLPEGKRTAPSQAPPVDFLLGYITEELDRGSSTFVPMSSVATGNTTQQRRGVAFAGIQTSPTQGLKAALWEYYGVDMFNTLYMEVDYRFPLAQTDGLQGWLALQAMDQRSVGQEITGSWSSQLLGGVAGLNYQGLELSLRLNGNFGGTGTTPTGAPSQFGLRSPWGRFPSFNKATIADFNMPEATVYGIWLSYDLGHLNPSCQGLGMAANYVFADRQTTGPAAGPNQGELDITLHYDVPALKGLSLKLQGSWLSYDDRPGSYTAAVNDYRVTINYSVPLL